MSAKPEYLFRKMDPARYGDNRQKRPLFVQTYLKREAEDKQAAADAAAEEAKRDSTLQDKAEAAEKAAKEAKVKQDEADDKAKKAAQEAKARRDEADILLSIWEREAKAQLTKLEAAKRTAQETRPNPDAAEAAAEEAKRDSTLQDKAEAAEKQRKNPK